MKGKILDFNIQNCSGVISGDDGVRYNFSSSEWKSEKNPSANQLVDFEVSAGDAVGIYIDKSAMSIDTGAIKEEILNITDSKMVKKILNDGVQNVQGFAISIMLAISFFLNFYFTTSWEHTHLIDGSFGKFLFIVVLVVAGIYYTGIKKEFIKIAVGISGFLILISFNNKITREYSELKFFGYIVFVLIIAYIVTGFKSKFKG